MSQVDETFFTIVGCVDGRVQNASVEFGKRKFGTEYPDTITEAGLVGMLANNPSEEFIKSLKEKIYISLEKHHSKGILVSGHAECAGNPVSDEQQKQDVLKSVDVIKSIVPSGTQVVPIFVKRENGNWVVEELQ